MKNPFIILLLVTILSSGCYLSDRSKDIGRSTAFSQILKSKEKKVADDFEKGKITEEQKAQYDDLLPKLMELETNVRSGY